MFKKTADLVAVGSPYILHQEHNLESCICTHCKALGAPLEKLVNSKEHPSLILQCGPSEKTHPEFVSIREGFKNTSHGRQEFCKKGTKLYETRVSFSGLVGRSKNLKCTYLD